MTSTSQSEVPTPAIKCGPYLSVKARSPAGHTTRIDIVQYKIDVRSLHCRRLLFRMGTTRGGRPTACASRSQQRASLARCLYGPQGCRWPRATPSQAPTQACMQALPLASAQGLDLDCVQRLPLNFSLYIPLMCHVSILFPLYLHPIQRFLINTSPIPHYNQKIPFFIPIHHLLSIFSQRINTSVHRNRAKGGACGTSSSSMHNKHPLPL
jgi:hypothetical protein